MGQVTAVIQAHAQDGVAGVQEREIHGGVRLRAGMRLHVGIGGTEQLLGPLDGESLGDVHEFAAAIVAFARVAFGILVGEYGALRFEHPWARVVLRGNQFDVIFLAAAFVGDGLREFRIEFGDGHFAREHKRSQKLAGKYSSHWFAPLGRKPQRDKVP